MTTPSAKEDAIEEIAEIIDLMLPFGTLGSVGAGLEEIDEEIIAAVLRKLSEIRAHPEKRKARREARLARKEARKLAKAKE